MIKKIKSWLLPLIPAAIGGVLGFSIMVLLKHFDMVDTNHSNGSNPWNALWALLILAACFFVQIIVHEGGHLVFGRLSGYRFVSFRVLRFTLIREDGHLKVRRYHIPGTGGQCLMMPPEGDGSAPFMLYNLGGVLMNLVVTLPCILYFCLAGFGSFFPDIIIAMMAVAGVLVVLTNAIPMKLSGVPNDGHNIITLKMDPFARQQFTLMLRVYGLQCSGRRLRDMPQEWFAVPEKGRYSDFAHITAVMLRAAWHLDHLDFAQALHYLERVKPYASDMAKLYRYEWLCELLFCELVTQCRAEVVEELYTPELAKYVRQCVGYQLGKKRLMHAYAIFVEKDNAKAETILSQARTMALRYPNRGEADGELQIMELVA